MLLLVTIGLVVIGAISLVIGFVSNSLGPIYISIACSVIAGVVLVVFSRMARHKEGAPAPAGSAAAPSPGSWAPASPPPPPPVTRAEPAPAPPPPPRPEPVRTMAAPEATTTTFTAPRGADAADLDFPIADYDSLRASQVLDQLGDLSLDELDMVREREEQGKNRATIIRRVDLRIDALEAEEDGDVASVASGRAAPAEPFPALGDDELGPAGDDDFPIANYDQLSTAEIISMLDDLDDDELDMVAEREEQGRNRLEILDYIDEMFEEVGPDGQPVAAAAPPARGPIAAPPARKATGKKAGAKKAAKKVPAKKIATPVAGATKASKATRAVKKAPGRPAAAKAAPAPAAAARKGAGGAKKAGVASPGTKSAARPTAGPAKATAGRPTVKKAVKAAAKKVPPVKKR